jgi:hypothetical protein
MSFSFKKFNKFFVLEAIEVGNEPIGAITSEKANYMRTAVNEI